MPEDQPNPPPNASLLSKLAGIAIAVVVVVAVVCVAGEWDFPGSVGSSNKACQPENRWVALLWRLMASTICWLVAGYLLDMFWTELQR